MMNLNNSPLQLKVVVLEELSIKFHQPQKTPNNLRNLPNYKVQLDFDILSNSKNTLDFLVAFNLSVNKGKKKNLGYVIALKVKYIFRIDSPKNPLNEKVISNLKTISAISIALAKTRELLANATQGYQLGCYYLPSIDVQALLKSKQKEISKASK